MALLVFLKKMKKKYITENNSDFLTETGLKKAYSYNDGFYRPQLVSSCNYDLVCGSKSVTTALRHSLS